jgi:hypothetical protein
MTRFWLRRTLSSIWGLVLAASMSISPVQATEMAAKMAMAPVMGVAAADTECPDCDRGMTAMDCRLAVCGGLGVATLVQMPAVAVRIEGLDLPVRALPSLVGWLSAPDPHPPRPGTFG